METFLRSVYYADRSMYGVYFAGSREDWWFAYLGDVAYLEDWGRFRKMLAEYGMDTESRHLILLPPHRKDYLNTKNGLVFTVGRNYYDLTSSSMSDRPYLGTLLLDADLSLFSSLVENADFGEDSLVCICDQDNMCFYSNKEALTGTDLGDSGICPDKGKEDELTICIPQNQYGISVMVRLDADTLDAPIRQARNMVYLAILIFMCFLTAASSFFAKRLTQPIKGMMEEMGKLEQGNFQVSLPVGRKDELGVLARRFVDMSHQLEVYIEQSYLAKIKQNEAEMTALKSQIYPHFLYNTLEIIRMTALEDGDGRKASKMIEALSEQIHYMIGTVQDFVYLEKEAEIVNKYVYLLNCRISGKIELTVSFHGFARVRVPKLILQPIVENAYMHGLKPRGGSGTIRLSAAADDGTLVVSVMDDGIGMDAQKTAELSELLNSDEIGIKREDNWQSIGLKNVHDRVRYLFGEGYGIEVTSCKQVGTLIQIRMPYEKEMAYAENGNSG